MATSGQYQYNPSLGELTLYAFNLCGIRPTALLQEHMSSAVTAANLLNGRWSSQTPNLWTVELITITLIEGQATYTIPANVIAILDGYFTISSGQTQTNRYMLPISRSEYASYPNPNQQGIPTVYWFDRLLAPNVTFYQAPDGTQASASFYCGTQIQDATLANGAQLQLPIYFMEAYALGLAQRLAMIWAPDKYAMLKAEATEAYAIAADQNVETASFYISPMISTYFRN